LYVYLLVTLVSRAITGKPIEMPFWELTYGFKELHKMRSTIQ